MGATSATGKGVGMAGSQKGPGNNRNMFEPMVNPHIIAAGKVTLDTNAAAVVFGGVDSVTGNYVVLTTVQGASLGSSNGSAAVANGVMTVTIKGSGASDVVNYAVIRMQGDPVTPLGSEVTE